MSSLSARERCGGLHQNGLRFRHIAALLTITMPCGTRQPAHGFLDLVWLHDPKAQASLIGWDGGVPVAYVAELSGHVENALPDRGRHHRTLGTGVKVWRKCEPYIK